MAADDLTTLSALKAWLGLPTVASPNDATLAALVTAASRAIYAWLSRPALLPRDYNETMDGESQRIFLRNWPVLNVASLAIEGHAIEPTASPSSPPSRGYRLQSEDGAPPGRPQALDVFGWSVRQGRQNVTIAYRAGYAISGESQSIPSASPWQVAVHAPYGAWGSDLGVVYASTGAPLTAVPSSPAAGQYNVSAGLYSFASTDAGANIAISYGYIPQDIVQAATELAAERFRAADRIGLRSKSLGGQETVSFDTSAMPATVLALLQPYRRTTP
jgi:hypothetical protein